MSRQRLAISICLLFLVAVAAPAQTITVNGEAPPSEVAVGAASSVALAVSGGPGNATDWVALFPTGAPDSGYLSWSYLSGTTAPPSSGLTSANLSVHAPLAAGTYEWRLFANNGWTRIATSTALSVTPSPAVLTVNGVTAPAEATAGAGSSLSVVLAGGPGNATDWVGLAPAGSPDTTLLDWRYLSGTTVPPSSGQASGTVHFLAPPTAGSYEVRLFAHGTYGRLASRPITVSASTAAVTVNDTAPPTALPVSAGTHVSVGITGGPAQRGDWVGLFAASASDSSIIAWQYLNGTASIPAVGVSDATLTFAVPVAPGSYEFRFFNAGTYTRLATSTTMVASASAAALSVNGVAAPDWTTAAPGSQAVVSVADGPANAGDWVGLYSLGESDSALLEWRYLNGTAQLPSSGVSTATLHFGVPTTPGTYELRFFANGTYNLLATSGPIDVPETVALITVNGVAPPASAYVEPGAALTVVVADGPANATDWVALAPADSSDSTYLAWQYLNGSSAPPAEGLASATLSFTLPAEAGTYEVRLFAHGSYQRITTSAPIVTAPPIPGQMTAGGVGHTLIVKSDGSVWAVGDNSRGQLGNDGTTTQPTPVQVSGLSDVVAVAAGAYHSLALTGSGVVYAWGKNADGQIGDNSTTDRQTPAPVSLTSIVAIAAGESHSVALDADGNVYTWGLNDSGQLGIGTTTGSLVPVPALSGARAIAAGFNHTLFVMTDGTVNATGLNTSGQLGTYDSPSTSSPVQMYGIWDAVAAAAGAGHSVVMLRSGTLVATGDGVFGQLGDGTTWQRFEPGEVATQTTITRIAAGAHHTLALDADGNLWAWGLNGDGQIGDGSTTNRTTPVMISSVGTLAAIGAGHHHSIGITAAGTVFSWGKNAYYQLGDGTVNNRTVPDAISGDSFAWRVATPVFSIAPGTYDTEQTVVVTIATADSTIHYTQNGDEPAETDPILASGAQITVNESQVLKARAWKTGAAASVTAVAAYTLKVATPAVSPSGGTFTTATSVTLTTATPGATLRYTTDGTDPTETSIVHSGAITVPATTIVRAAGFKAGWSTSDVRTALYTRNFGTLAAGGGFMNVARLDGALWSWGANATGQLGSGSAFAFRRLPVLLAAVPGVVGAAAGDAHTLLLTNSGTVAAMGSNVDSRLGDGTTTQRNAPINVPGLTDVIQVAAGNRHSLALKSDGTVAAWGRNTNGQLGLGTTTNATSPTAVTALSGVTAISAGGFFSLALKADGSVWSAGLADDGRLGDGAGYSSSEPVAVWGVSTAIAIDAGDSHALALLADGSVVAWGRNALGALGNGSTDVAYSPVATLNATGITAVAAGTDFSLLLKSDGTVLAVGANSVGQLGIGTRVHQSTRVTVTGLSNIVAIAAGNTFAMALDATGVLYAWGDASNAQLGDGTTEEALTPRVVSGPDFTWLTNAPRYQPVGATYGAPTSVTILSDTPGAEIRYTIDGEDPTQSATLFTAPFVIANTATVKARAFSTSSPPSRVITAAYVLQPAQPVATPVASTYTSPRNVSLSTTTPSSIIYFTVDGTPPTTSSSVYSAPIPISTRTELKAIAVRNGWTASPIYSGLYQFNYGTLAVPVFSLTPGTYVHGQLLTMSSIAGAAIRFTSDGSAPDTSSPIYSGPVSLTTGVTVRARAYHPDWTTSGIATAAYTVKTATPVFSPGAGPYAPSQSITITVSTPGATVRYTTNGQDPTEADRVIATGDSVPVGNFTLKARAWLAGILPSDIAAAAYERNDTSCSYGVTPGALELSAAAHGGLIGVTANQPACAWSASVDSAWVSLNPPTGTGSGSLAYTVQPNSSGGGRVAFLTVEDQYIAIIQQGVSTCSFVVSPGGIAAAAAGESGTLAVTASDPSCVWNAASPESWVALGSSVSPYSSTVLGDQPIGYWRLNESSGTAIADSSLSAHHGVIAGTVTLSTPGALQDGSTSVQFDGSGGRVEVADSAVFALPHLSWEAWINAGASTNARRVLGKGTTNEMFSLSVGAGATAPTFAWTVDGMRHETTATTAVVGAGWVHLAFTFDGTTWRTLVNGVENQTGTTAGLLSPTAESVIIGAGAEGAGAFDGQVDEVAIYPYALSPAQVAHHVASRLGQGIGSASLPFTVALNETGAARTATLTVADTAVPISQAGGSELAIAAVVSPPPNAAGWNNTPVVVSFVCAGAGTIVCPDAEEMSTDGVFEVTRQMANDLSQSGSVTVTVRIDRTAPYVTVSSPGPGALVPSGSLTVSGTVLEMVSTAVVTCDGAAATVADGAFSCTASVPSGTSVVGIVAIDLAGNTQVVSLNLTTSDNVGVEPTALRITPQHVTLGVGETRRFRATDNLGRVPADAVWTIDNETAATLSTTNGVELTGVAAGEATITATWHGLSATSDVTIVTTLSAAGTTLWSNPPLVGTAEEVVRGATAPDGTRLLYAVEREGNASVLRAFEPEGQEVWARSLPGRVEQLSGDPLGGAVLLLRTNWGGDPIVREVRTFAPDGRSALVTAADSPGFAIHPDGPLYAVVGQQLKAFNIGLGGGRTVALPAGTEDTVGGIPTVLADGSVVLPMRVTGGAHSPGESLDLLWMKPDGAVDVFPVDRDPTSFFQSFTVWPHKAIPNGLGGVLVTYDIRYYFAFAYHEARLRLVNADGSFGGWSAMGGTSTLGSWGPRLGRDGGDLVLGEEWVRATSYRTIGTTTVARITDFTRDGHFGLDVFLDGGDLPEFTALEGSEFFASYADGSTDGPDPGFSGIQLASAKYAGFDSWLGRDAQGAVNLRVGMSPGEASEWAVAAGGGQWGNSALLRSEGLFIKLQTVVLGKLHASLRLVPHNQSRWASDGPFNESSNPPFNSPSPLDGRKWTTVGAGPSADDSSWTCSGTLIGNFNRPGDVEAFAYKFERLDYPRALEDLLITKILAASLNYDNDLPYACDPNPGDQYYNSNSYISGLLMATRFGTPRIIVEMWRSLPGWNKPVPDLPGFFGPIVTGEWPLLG